MFTGGANAVYWIRPLRQLDDGNLVVENVVERAKRKAPKVQCEIESGLVYELCRGAELGKEETEGQDSIAIICPHTKFTKMQAIDLEIMKNKYPLTLNYLTQFKDILDERKGFASWEKSNQEDAFYREVAEETGCKVEIIKYLGVTEEYKYKNNFKQISYIFVSKGIEDTQKLNLTQKEKDEGAKLLWVEPIEALELIQNCINDLKDSQYEDVYATKFVVLRDRRILEYYLDI